MDWLVDPSVWIGFLRGQATAPVRRLRGLLAGGEVVGLTPVVLMEILQGTRSAEHFERYREYFGAQPSFDLRHGSLSYVEAAALYFRCRRAGVTVRSTIDCIVAQVAIEHGLTLLHDDEEFRHMARVVPELKQSRR